MGNVGVVRGAPPECLDREAAARQLEGVHLLLPILPQALQVQARRRPDHQAKNEVPESMPFSVIKLQMADCIVPAEARTLAKRRKRGRPARARPALVRE